MTTLDTPLLEAKSLTKRFSRTPDLAERIAGMLGAKVSIPTVHAVNDIDLAIFKGEVVGLVGESGCGKSTLGRMLAGILPKTTGTFSYKGTEEANWSDDQRDAAALQIQMVFQDPMSSLNPRKRVRDIVGEAPVYHGLVSRREASDYVAEVLEQVGLDPSYRNRLPHQFSGGQRQRINIARALAVKPEMLICDESVAALDVSIQAQVLNLFMDLREKLGLTYLFISHDLGVVEHLSDRVAIMYLGRIIELAPTEDLFETPNHPYTRALLEEIPRIGAGHRDFQPVKGEIPSPYDPPSGCAFHPRCPHATERCRLERPALTEIAPQRMSACHLNDPQPLVDGASAPSDH